MSEFSLSRVMRMSDYDELKTCSDLVKAVQNLAGPPHPQQHRHRLWEYSLMLYAYGLWREYPYRKYQVGDFGCGIGLSPAIMLAEGHDVTMYEPWVHGDGEEYQLKQCGAVQTAMATLNKVTTATMCHRPLCELVDDDYDSYDVSLCISTIEHIGEYQRAFRDLCRTVRPEGLMFLTMDYADHAKDDYECAWLRAGVMPTEEYMHELLAIGKENGFSLFGSSDWGWREECRLVNNYGFASLCLVRSN